MSRFIERKEAIVKLLKPYIYAFNLENNKHLHNDINSTLYKSIEEAIIALCENQLKMRSHFYEAKKYLIGKIYRAQLVINKKEHPAYKPPWQILKADSYQNCQGIAYNVGKKYSVSGSSVIKYDLFARSIDILSNGTSISVNGILRGIEKIPGENIIQLSKMEDKDISYLKFLFSEKFFKLAGYTTITDDIVGKNNVLVPKNDALIKQMPKYDPNAMIASLSFTIPSWIDSIKKAISSSDLTIISENTTKTLQTQLTDLHYLIIEILRNLEETRNE